MKKKQSKKMNQLKYLVLIPVLASMLFYTSCAETASNEVSASKLQLQTRYSIKEGKLVGKEGTKDTYLDSYLGMEAPTGANEVAFEKLSTEEQDEFNLLKAKFDERFKDKPEFNGMVSFKFYKMSNGRNATAMFFNFEKLKAREESRVNNSTSKDLGVTIKTETEDVSFMIIDKAPTFPGCESGDKDCFSKEVQKHFSRNFNADLPNQLGLEAGRKRIFIGFKIDKEGNVVDVNARAPHKDLKEEVIAVMNSLPKMIPGEHEGKRVGVKYSIPVSIIVN